MNARIRQLPSTEEIGTDADVAARTGRPLSGTVEYGGVAVTLAATPVAIEVACVARPAYDNTSLGWEDDWIEANRDALLLWWNAGEKDDADYESFIKSQHDIELARRDEFRRTLRMYE